MSSRACYFDMQWVQQSLSAESDISLVNGNDGSSWRTWQRLKLQNIKNVAFLITVLSRMCNYGFCHFLLYLGLDHSNLNLFPGPLHIWVIFFKVLILKQKFLPLVNKYSLIFHLCLCNRICVSFTKWLIVDMSYLYIISILLWMLCNDFYLTIYLISWVVLFPTWIGSTTITKPGGSQLLGTHHIDAELGTLPTSAEPATAQSSWLLTILLLQSPKELELSSMLWCCFME